MARLVKGQNAKNHGVIIVSKKDAADPDMPAFLALCRESVAMRKAEEALWNEAVEDNDGNVRAAKRDLMS